MLYFEVNTVFPSDPLLSDIFFDTRLWHIESKCTKKQKAKVKQEAQEHGGKAGEHEIEAGRAANDESRVKSKTTKRKRTNEREQTVKGTKQKEEPFQRNHMKRKKTTWMKMQKAQEEEEEEQEEEVGEDEEQGQA